MSAVVARGAEQIRTLNDRLRCHFIGGQVMITQGIQAGGQKFRVACVQAIRAYQAFDEDSDPECEHDFGAVTVCGERVFWKIDYYDRELDGASPDPSDPTLTTRVLTILLASEW